MQNPDHQTNHNSKNSFSIRELTQVLSDWVRDLLPIGRARGGSQGVTQSREACNPMTTNRDAEFLGNPMTTNRDAEFLGWQKTKDGRAFALYNVMAEEHPLYRSTVTEKTLRKENLEIPPIPPPQQQLKRFDQKK
jgi:hypothetical protein